MARLPSSATACRSARKLLGQPLLGLQLVLGEQASLDALGEVNLFLGSQQLTAADRFQVSVDGVAHNRGLVVQVSLGHARRGLPDRAVREFGKLCVNIGELSAGGGCRRHGLVGRCRRNGVSWLVAQLHASLGKLADDGTGLRRGNSRLVKGIAKFGQGEIALATAALDQLVHVGRGLLILAGSKYGRCPRHESPPFVGAYRACARYRASAGALNFRAEALGGLGSAHRGHYLVTHGAAKCSRLVGLRPLKGGYLPRFETVPVESVPSGSLVSNLPQGGAIRLPGRQ